jgi:hypothetical protein
MHWSALTKKLSEVNPTDHAAMYYVGAARSTL